MLQRVTLTLAFVSLSAAPAQADPFWLAGRYDGNRIIVYFGAVKLKGTIPSTAAKIAYPVADGFFSPVMLPRTYVAGLQKGPGSERFAVGDHYDLLLGGGGVATVTLTTLVGFEGDEETGNDSFIGALATLDDRDALLFQRNYYVVRRHVALGRIQTGPHAAISEEAVRFDVQIQAVSLLKDAARTDASGRSPAFKMEQFTLPDGSLRYYARAGWDSQKPGGGPAYALGAWLSPTPALHILAVENQTASYGFDDDLPILRNVVDLGSGKTGIIVSVSGDDGRVLRLMEYRDGVDLAHMRILQNIGSAE
jgi:hypothetical protein